MSEEEDKVAHWHLDRRVNVGHLVTTAMLAGSLVVWAMTIETRLAEHGVQITSVAEQIERIEDRNNSNMIALTDVINRINDKLDRLIERK